MFWGPGRHEAKLSRKDEEARGTPSIVLVSSIINKAAFSAGLYSLELRATA